MTFQGPTDGSHTSGSYYVPLVTDVTAGNTVNNIRIPKGTSAKIWGIRASTNQVEVIIQYSLDVTVGGPTWVTISRQDLASAGVWQLEKRKPIIMRSNTGKEGFSVTWVQAVATIAQIEIDVEMGSAEEED